MAVKVNGYAKLDDLKFKTTVDSVLSRSRRSSVEEDSHESKNTVIRLKENGPNQLKCKSGRSKSAKVNGPKI